MTAAPRLDIPLVLNADGVSAAVEKAQSWLEEEAEVDARAAMHVALTLDELLTNASTHGGAEGQPAEVRLQVLPDRVGVEITDPAAAFDPRQAPKPDVEASLQDRPIGGLGVHLVMKLSRDLAYGRDKDRNRTNYWIARGGSAG
ncbi:MAG TPA: ATP-binding protein [Caulobacteraceae bacterium]|jgi:anti-sigma regulatory factor (Ser/Thr protein kinase)|nr:ATP-binding protein [Caulobacteraceae bacterium]